MSSIRDLNQAGPFWDLLNGLPGQLDARAGENERGAGPWGPFGWGGRFPHRGRFGPHPHGPPQHEGAPDGDNGDASPPPPDYEGPHSPPSAGDDAGEGPSNPRGPHAHPHHRHGSHEGHGHGPNARRGCPGRRGGGWGGRHRGPPPFGPQHWFQSQFGNFLGADPADFAAHMQSLFGNASGTARDGANDGAAAADFKPSVDVFDTESAFVVHASLPGAKKEDIAVSWDGENSELVIGGVIYRPGDEDFLKTLALDERSEVGAFERKVRLGTRVTPAQVEVEGIGAKLEDGILRIEVPKLDKDYVEIKKVDVE